MLEGNHFYILSVNSSYLCSWVILTVSPTIPLSTVLSQCISENENEILISDDKWNSHKFKSRRKMALHHSQKLSEKDNFQQYDLRSFNVLELCLFQQSFAIIWGRQTWKAHYSLNMSLPTCMSLQIKEPLQSLTCGAPEGKLPQN